MRLVLSHRVLVRLNGRPIKMLIFRGNYLDIVLIHGVRVFDILADSVEGRVDAGEVVAEGERVDGVGNVELVEGEGDEVHEVEQALLLGVHSVASVQLLMRGNVEVACQGISAVIISVKHSHTSTLPLT